ncbi:MAG: GGDEF domain-containing protein [Gemmatimonadetes bacterium]|nr:GGDEF domain-containing protein [Gemmatimonadota bacterium]
MANRLSGYRPPLGGAVLAYAAALLSAPWLPLAGMLAAAIAAAAFLALAWLRAGRPASALFSAALWPVLHTFLLASGGLASPLLPLVATWLLLLAMQASRRRATLAAAAAIALLLAADAWTAALTLRGGLAALAAAAAGLLPAAVFGRLGGRLEAQERVLERIAAEAGGRGERGEEAEAARRLRELERTLEALKRSLGAWRATLWDVDAAGERALPQVASGGEAPAAARLAGDPLRWAWEEGMPLRLESPPAWAAPGTRACVVPIDPGGERNALLTLEYDSAAALPETAALEAAAAHLRVFLRMQLREARAVATRERFRQVLELLRRLPREIELDTFARELAESARALVGGTGAALAAWDEGAGAILAVVGEDGGPAPGAAFAPLESELALAARGGAAILREHRRARRRTLPVAVTGERWLAQPLSLAAVPLPDASRAVLGVLAVWSTKEPRLDPEAVGVLETLAPYAGLQLRHARQYHQVRDDAERDALTGLHNRRAFEERMAAELARFQRYRRPVALLLADIDHFKQINDTYGHEAGDAVLRALAQTVRGSVRETDFAARLGGEEFVALLPETGLGEAQEAAQRLLDRVRRGGVAWRGRVIPVRVSIGVSACPECVPEPGMVLRSADAMLYTSKAAGRNRVTAAPVDSGAELA